MTGLLAKVDWVGWALLLGRVAVLFVVLLVAVMLVVWLERKFVADMQMRLGPTRAGPFGILITLADGVKLFFKEGITPVTADVPVYLAAPLTSLVPAMLAFAVIPFGAGVTLFHHRVPFQVTDINVGILWVLAMGSLAVYGIVLAGWSSGSNYPLLGAIRSTAQMISYEVGMGLGLVAVLLYSGTVTMSGIVAVQARHFHVTGLGWLPKWNIFFQLPAFVLYYSAAIAETNRPPFDLAEAETELVAGYHTEYSGIKFAMFFLAEYMHMITVSAVAVTLFFGGWHGPMFQVAPWLWPLVWFVLKLVVVIFVFVWIRATLPRFRYDKLMAFGWKVLIPLGLVWILMTAGYVELPKVYPLWRAVVILVAFPMFAVVGLWSLQGSPSRRSPTEDQEAAP